MYPQQHFLVKSIDNSTRVGPFVDLGRKRNETSTFLSARKEPKGPTTKSLGFLFLILFLPLLALLTLLIPSSPHG